MTELDGLRAALLDGQVALLPTDTVYGLMAALDVSKGVAALYDLKGRSRDQPCQVVVYSRAGLDDLLATLPLAICEVVAALLPGPVTTIVPDPTGRYAAAAGAESGSVGIRAPVVTGALARLDLPLIATSANHPGEPDAASLWTVSPDLRGGCGIVVDAGTLSATPSAVVDLRGLDGGAPARLMRPGADPEALAARIRACSVEVDWSSGGGR
jgi:L-threonylcarbamoyladenylate synthase